jgi:hypothetical protein
MHRHVVIERAGSEQIAGVDVMRRQNPLRKGIAHHASQTNARGIDVALIAGQALLHRKDGLGACAPAPCRHGQRHDNCDEVQN